MAGLFVLPTATLGQYGPIAAYLSTAGWAAAGARVLGAAWIICPTGLISPAEARRRGTQPARASGPVRPTVPATIRAHAPSVVKTLAKDVRRFGEARRFKVDPNGPWRDHDVDFVWQRHELFHTAGSDLAQALGVPSVLFVPATTVWEAERWGTRRPGWSHLAERVGECPSIRRADVVACGTREVMEQVVRLGAREERAVLTPSGVDLDRFGPSESSRRAAVRERLGVSRRFVVGWVGSFRPFHAIERAVAAIEHLDDAALLLVGNGPERAAVEAHARARGVEAVFTGTVGHAELPQYLAAMDVGLVVAPKGAGFHYSPLKLGEYLAAGLAVVAPAVRPVTTRLTDGVDALLVPPDDDEALRRAIERLHDNAELHRRLGEQARVTAEKHWSWDEQVRRVLDAVRASAGSDSVPSP